MFFKRTHPQKRYIYAITGGKYLGELLVYVSQTADNYSFLSLPIMKNRDIPKDKFDFGLKERIIDVVEKVPGKVYRICAKQHEKNIATNAICD